MRALLSHISLRNFINSARCFSVIPAVTSSTAISLWATMVTFSPVSCGTLIRTSCLTSLLGQPPQRIGFPMLRLTSAHFWQVDGTTGRLERILMPAARMSLVRPFLVRAYLAGVALWTYPLLSRHSSLAFSIS